MKKILGLDLGTNSIGWALVDIDEKRIEGMGSRIIPMTQDVLDTFSGGKPLETQTAARTAYRSTRRLRERHLLRRERLHRVLNILGFLPEHYSNLIDFNKKLGQFSGETDAKLAYNNRDFLFKKSFEEMLIEFKQSQPQLFYTKPNGKETKIPYDWTIYYLRKKALSHKIEKQELAWIILNFNQKRGYYQLRGEDDTDATRTAQTRVYFDTQVIDNITDTGNVYKGLKIIQVTLANGDMGKYFSKDVPKWIGSQKNIIATIDLDNDGNDRLENDGTLKRRFSIPTEEDWEKKWKLIKIKTEKEIKDAGKTVGDYIYESLLKNPSQKIRGKLVRTIERKLYKEELVDILKKQLELQPEFFTDDLYNECLSELYRNNKAQQLVLSKRDFVHFFVEDIIFYQRPLRSQKSSIGNCSLEYRVYKDKDGNQIKEYLKVIPKSHPLYQEFRVWQWLSNLKISKKEDDIDVTAQFIKNLDDNVSLFEYLMLQKEIGHKDILKHLLSPILKEKYPNAKAAAFNKEVDKEISKYRWNFVFDDSKEKEEDKSKKYPCNTTGYEIRRRLEKVADVSDDFLEITDIEDVVIKKGENKGKKITVSLGTREIQLWHIIYSVTDKNEYKSALGKFAKKYLLDEDSFVANFEKFPPFKSEYGSYSEKAIKKILPLLRMGKYWNWIAIDNKSQVRIEKIVTGEYDENIKNRVREKTINLTDNNHFQGLPIWLSSYIIYDRHSEAKNSDQWQMSQDIQQYLYSFKQHELRNPIVEQIITETLRVVKDIWEIYANKSNIPYSMVYDLKKKKNVKSYNCFFDEIHVELGREMKNTADDRKWLTEQVSNNEATNLRIKALLMELKENSDGKLLVENVRPHSPMQQDALKIYEEYALQNNEKYDENKKEFIVYPIAEDILKISKTAQPSKAELQRYKLWLEQRYRSPYTGNMIPLGRLFTEDYQIEHVIPRSRYFDNSFNNKVICESAVNQLKDKFLGLEFIKEYFGQEVELGLGKRARIFTENEYKDFVKDHYSKNKTKRQNLLLEDIPEQMIARQMNDTRYISKYISSLLSNIVRADKEDDGINSKNLIPGNGKITTALKKDWGLDSVWNDLILPRFERMNQLTNSDDFTYWNEQYQKFLPVDYSPADSKRIEKKRIDHRHHAMDALAIACMTRDHVNLLNNQSAKSETSRYDLQNKLRCKSRETWFDKKINKQVERDVFKEFKKPWDTFSTDANNALKTIIISFKQNLRVINKATNNYEKWIEKDGKKVKEKVKQEGINWAIRKSLHEETVSGKIDLPWVNVSKGNFLTATRKNIDSSFTIEKTRKITDTGIQKILEEHLKQNQNNADLAFSPQGLEDLNRNIAELNDGKNHKPIFKVRLYEMGSSRFSLGLKNNKQSKFVQGAPNLYFARYSDSNNKKVYETIPLNIVIERLKQGLEAVPEKNTEGYSLQNFLSPLDLVYLPTVEEFDMPHLIDFSKLNKHQIERLYNVNDFSGVTAYFIQNSFAKNIYPKEMDLSWNDKKQKLSGSFDSKTASYNKRSIKEICIKLKVDRLGNISL